MSNPAFHQINIQKALLVQSLFFMLPLLAQEVRITGPAEGEPLSSVQEITLRTSGGTPSRVELFLNGRLILARTKPPFVFEVHWDTTRANEIMVTATFENGKTATDQRVFREIVPDVALKVATFQCFPYLQQKPDGWTLRVAGRDVQPESFVPATFPLDMLVVLDVSGSMRPFLGRFESFLAGFLERQEVGENRVDWVVFDGAPRRIGAPPLRDADVNGALTGLYRGQAKSVIWDALVTAATLYGDSPRRVILLISDGADDGSRHEISSATAFLKQSGASLIWLNPTNLPNAPLRRLATRTGGFSLGTGVEAWRALETRIANQHHLLAPEARYPITLTVRPGQVWYPRWQE